MNTFSELHRNRVTPQIPKSRVMMNRKSIAALARRLSNQRNGRRVEICSDAVTCKRIMRLFVVMKTPTKSPLGFYYWLVPISDSVELAMVTHDRFDLHRHERRRRGWKKTTLGLALDWSDVGADYKIGHPERHRLIYFKV